MFIGHFALGFAAKRSAPSLSLGLLFGAAIFADLLWPILVAAGIERVRITPGITAFTPLEFLSYPYSHSLITLVIWGVLLAWISTRGGLAFAVVSLLVVSHWVLDVITHIPDMPLYPGGPRYGLGLWNSIPVTLSIEAALFAAAVWMYARVTRSRDRTGRWGFAGLTAFLIAAFILNATSPPPPSVTLLWIGAIVLGVVTVSLAHWMDSHRVSEQS